MRGWLYIIICKIVLISLFLTSCHYNLKKIKPGADTGNINLKTDTLIPKLVAEPPILDQNCYIEPQAALM